MQRAARDHRLAAMTKKHIAVLCVAACLAGLTIYWRHRTERAEADAQAQQAALELADAAVVALNKAEPGFATDATSATASVTGAAIASTASAGRAIHDTLVPVLDRYLALIDRAVVATDVYLASSPDLDAKTLAAIEKTRKRAHAVHIARDKLARLAADATAGNATVDAIASAIETLGLELIVNN